MKNIRKTKVENISEIAASLYLESLERGQYFMDKASKIANNDLVKEFWNLLVDYKKNDKFFKIEDDNEPFTYANYITAVLGGNIAAQVFNAAGLETTGTLTSFAAFCVAMAGLKSTLVNDPKKREIDAELNFMMIQQPELYDIELCFNNTRRECVYRRVCSRRQIKDVS